MENHKFHEALNPLSWLAGKWNSLNGEGTYPTIEPFSYHDTMEFTSVGQPMFNFTSSSCHPLTRKPLHQERGFLRVKPGTNHFSFIVAHNMGLSTIEEGSYSEDRKELILKTISIARMSFSKSPAVRGFERRFRLAAPGSMEMTLSMETDDTPMCEHLKAVYQKLE